MPQTTFVSSKGLPRLQGSHLSQPLPWNSARLQILFIVQILLDWLSKWVNKIRNIPGFGLFSLFYEKSQELSFLSLFALFLYAEMYQQYPHPEQGPPGSSSSRSFTLYPIGWGLDVGSAATKAQLAPLWSCLSPQYRAHWETGGGSFHRAVWEFADAFPNKKVLDQQNSSWS